jgi:eukaryotic-like serine/threonine-protein kinase
MDKSRLYDQLVRCTVRLTVPGVRCQGTGFFVAPGRLLTCAHVVEAAWPDKAVEVHWAGRTIPGQIEREHYRPKPGPDLALLRIEMVDHPCVLLHEAYTLGDEMLAFGYPIGSTIGDPVTLVSEDWQRDREASPDQPHLKLKEGQVQPGLSGAPLLNRRTGGVCGVVRLSRDRASDLGGRALPTSLVHEQYDFLKGLQRAFHNRDRTWIRLRSTERKWDSRNRMLEKVRSIWIDGRHGLLKETLIHDTRVLLGLSECLGAVVPPPPAPPVRRPDQEQPLPPGMRVVDAFDEIRGEALLILGQPGSGKTTLLLELTDELLERAAADASHPIPVVFPLSTWAESRRSIAEWLVDELSRTDGSYRIDRKRAQNWVDQDQILPLLDGLDEVKPEHLAACVRAINDFRNTHSLLPLVICSRTADYQALSVPFQVQDAIVVQPLTRSQVDTYFADLGPSGGPIRRALDVDPSLWDLLDTPLMLWAVTMTYAGDSDARLCPGGSREERRNRVFGAYVDRVLRHRYEDRMGPSRGGESGRRDVDADDEVGRRGKPYPRARTLHWLDWLAHQMANHGQTVIYIERLQPDWLPEEQRWAFGLPVGLGTGLVAGLGAGLGTGLVGGLLGGLVGGLGTSLVGGLVSGLQEGRIEGIGIGAVSWSWRKSELVGGLLRGLFIGLGGGLVTGLVGGLFGGLGGGLVTGLVGGLLGGLVGGLLGGLVTGLVGGLLVRASAELEPELGDAGLGGYMFYGLIALIVGGPYSVRIDPLKIENLHISIFSWSALIVGLVTVLVVGLVGGLVGGLVTGLVGGLVGGIGGGLVGGLLGGLSVGLVIGLVTGLVGGLGGRLYAGGRACLMHLALRLLLVRSGSIPWNYVKFLDYATERILLRKVGAGYTFIHRMLLEYFAARYDESSVGATPKTGSS